MSERPKNSRKFNHVLSKQLSIQIEAKPAHCFANAIKALEFVPAAKYVEGYIVSSVSSKPNHHAWLELDDEIIDPSIPGGHPEYFFGACRTYTEYLDIVKEATERVEMEKKKGPPPEEERWRIPPNLLEEILNPNYDQMLETSIRTQMSLTQEKSSDLERACEEAKSFQKQQGWPTKEENEL